MSRRNRAHQPKLTPEKAVTPPPIRTPNTDWREVFLVSLGETGNVSRAAKDANVTRQVAYQQRENDPEFAKQWDDAKQRGLETLADVANERARNGSDTLLIFLLKAHDPKRYRENIDVTSGDAPLLNADVIGAALQAAMAQLAEWERNRHAAAQ